MFKKINNKISQEEWSLRCDLAACYRLVVENGWEEMNNSHITARIPGESDKFLVNPHDLCFDEINASSLIKVNLEGEIIFDTLHTVNPAAFLIHSAIYHARNDINCIMHTHTTAGAAVSAQKNGLLPISQQALLFYKRCVYHDFEGIFLEQNEQKRLIKNLGSKDILFLRNHGLLTCADTIPKVYAWMFFLEKACKIQLAAQASGEELIIPDESTCRKTMLQAMKFSEQTPSWWPGLMRRLDRKDSTYKE